ncbi:MAG: sulfite exporter TauE/SafE family protein, partial [Solirubrobacteraceae bacterium]
GILLLAILSLAFDDALQRLNGTKNILAGLANLLSGAIFAIVAHVSWPAVGLIALGSISGGTLGARYGRRLRPEPLRALIVAVGIVAIVRLL